jgi:transcriptional regulator with XRE-family HTH domain
MQETFTSKKISTPNRHLRGARELRGWTREYVAERIGSDSKSVARWERGATFPHPYYRQKLCELFERNAVELGFVAEENSAVAEPPPAQPSESLANQEAKLYVKADQVVFENLPAPPFPASLLRLLIILTICGILVTGSILTLTVYTARSAAPPSSSPSKIHIRPGGVWVNPANGQNMRGSIYLLRKPTRPIMAARPSIMSTSPSIGRMALLVSSTYLKQRTGKTSLWIETTYCLHSPRTAR